MPDTIATGAVPATRDSQANTLVLGLGNTVLSDDGVGVHVVRQLETEGALGAGIRLQDGGTIGLGLLPDIASSGALIVVDAAEIGATPGAIKVFEGPEMDAQVGKNKGSVHEIALADVMTAAAISDTQPPKRALVAIQPAEVGWGTEPTAPVAAAIPEACRKIEELIEQWSR